MKYLKTFENQTITELYLNNKGLFLKKSYKGSKVYG